MTDASTVTAAPAISPELAATIENDASGTIAAAASVSPAVAADVTKGFAWYNRYAKGIVVAIGTVATLALATFPPAGPVYHYADYVFGAVTIIGVIAARNAPPAPQV